MQPSDPTNSPIESAAAQWLARRDRRLSAAEQDAYLQWLRENPGHGAEIARLEKSWARLDALQQWRPAHAIQPNPDLLVPQRRAARRIWFSAFAAAAALAAAAVLWRGSSVPRAVAPTYTAVEQSERLTLPDGSMIELNAGASVVVDYTPAARNVGLLAGEAHFIVARDAARPFVVSIGQFSVHATGTAFAVQKSTHAISVLVTEGKVHLNRLASDGRGRQASSVLSRVIAGQKATIATQGGAPQIEVKNLTAPEMDRALAWQTMRLEFVGTPLKDVVAMFNRYNGRQLVIEDAATGEIAVGGKFRADNLEAFLRLMEIGFGVNAHPNGDEIVLRNP